MPTHRPVHMQAAMMLAERTTAIEKQAAAGMKLPLAAEYALAQLQHEHLSSPATQQLPPAANLLPGGALERLAPGTPGLLALQRREAALERQLFDGQRPDLTTPCMAAAVASLAVFEISRLQVSIVRTAQQVGG